MEELPKEVIEALIKGNKIEAIKLLRENNSIDLKEAKETVEAYLEQVQTLTTPQTDSSLANTTHKNNNPKDWALPIITVLAFVWAFINIITPISSGIVLAHLDGYYKTTFTVTKLYYHNDHESGLSWGFEGELPDRTARMLAPDIADGKALGYKGLKKLFPTETVFDIWFNPDVTTTLFQDRTINLIPYTPDLKSAEMARIKWWLNYCLLPLAVLLIFNSRYKNSKRRRQSAS